MQEARQSVSVQPQPALCPALSLAQPWPGPATSTVTVFQLSGGNSRLVLGEFEPPQPPVRAVPNGARPRCGLGRHCGPAAVTYSLLRLEVSRNIDYNYVMRRGSPADLMCRPVAISLSSAIVAVLLLLAM